MQANDAVERLWANVCDLPGAIADIEDQWTAEWGTDPRMPGWERGIEEDDGLYTIEVSWTDRVDENTIDFSFTTAIPDLPGCP